MLIHSQIIIIEEQQRRLAMLRLKSIRPDEDQCPMVDTTTDKGFLPPSATIMKKLEGKTCTQCGDIIGLSSSKERKDGPTRHTERGRRKQTSPSPMVVLISLAVPHRSGQS
jgi:hypothetical protein